METSLSFFFYFILILEIAYKYIHSEYVDCVNQKFIVFEIENLKVSITENREKYDGEVVKVILKAGFIHSKLNSVSNTRSSEMKVYLSLLFLFAERCIIP